MPDAFSRPKALQVRHLRANIARQISLRHGLPQIDLFVTKLSLSGFNSNRGITSAMDLRPGVCLPSNPSYSINSEEDRTVSIDVVNSFSLAPKPWLPSLFNLVYRQPHGASLQERPGMDLSTNKAPPNICSLNLTVWPITKNLSVRSVFQKNILPYFLQLEKGTLSRYNSCWNKWSKWCQERGLSTVTFL